jgi:amino acid transporter
MTEASHHAEPGRVIGVAGVAFTSFNCIVGVGIFGLPGLVAAVLGPAAILAYAACLVLVALVGLCLAEAGSRVPHAGGLYAYATAAFGPVVGGVTGALALFATSIGSAAALARFFIDTLAGFVPAAGTPVGVVVVLVALYGFLGAANTLGAQGGGRLAVVFGVLKFTPLLLLIVVGAFAVQPHNLVWTSVPPVPKVGEGALLLFFAFMGVESGLCISGETRNPARTVPRAIVLALGTVAVLYIGLQTVTQGVLGSALAASKAPLADTAGAVFGPAGAALLGVLTLLSAAGYLAADMLGSPRIAFALARAGQLPRVVGRIHPHFGTPAIAIWLYSALVVLVALSGTFQQIAVLAVAGTLVTYLICCLGVLRLRARGIVGEGAPFVAPGGWAAPVGAAAMIVWLFTTLAPHELVATLAFVAVFAAAYAITGARRRSVSPAG